MDPTTQPGHDEQAGDPGESKFEGRDVTGSKEGQVSIRLSRKPVSDEPEAFLRNLNRRKSYVPRWTIRLFGNLGDLAGQTEIGLPVCATVDAMKESLYATCPQLKQATFAIAVNQKIVTGNQALNPGDEIALLPPFSGG